MDTIRVLHNMTLSSDIMPLVPDIIYSTKTVSELKALCRERNIAGTNGKNKAGLIALLGVNQDEHQDTGKFRKNAKDQFYTDDSVAKLCVRHIVNHIPDTLNYLWLEPSAGSGAFLHNTPLNCERRGFDLEPKAADISEQDFLVWGPPEDRDVIVFGNPPFGRQSSLAKLFIAKSCKFARVIAFILPRSFTKPSMFNSFDPLFHLVISVELEENSFILNGSKYDVPCVFQIWQKRDMPRSIEEKVVPRGFQYVKASSNYDMAFRRVGGLAGKCYRNDGTNFSIQTHYFMKLDDDALPHIDAIIEKNNSHTFPSNTLGPRSLSKSEVNVVVNNIIQSISS